MTDYTNLTLSNVTDPSDSSSTLPKLDTFDDDGVIFTRLIDSANVGTGGIKPFLTIASNEGSEEGYNTDYSPLPMDDNRQQWTNDLRLDALQVVSKGGKDYYMFTLDVNETGSDTLSSLDKFKVYVTNTPSQNLSNISQIDGQLVYDLDANVDRSILIDSSVSEGSGNGYDVQILIPVEKFAAAGNLPYVVLYSQFGATPGYDSSAGFEEWSAILKPTTGIHLEKITGDGPGGNIVDGDGVEIAAGAPVTWTYTVTNTGTVALSNVVVTDDNGTPGNTADDFQATLQAVDLVKGTGDLDGDGKLDAKETWIFTASGVAIKGEYSNLGTVSANYKNGTFTDIDNSWYHNPNPGNDFYGMEMHKTVEKVIDYNANGLNDAGDLIVYTIEINNTGTLALTNVELDDDMAGIDAQPLGSLLAGQTREVTAYYQITQSDVDTHGTNAWDKLADGILTNTATASAEEVGDVTDTADTPIDYKPGMSITKDQVFIVNKNSLLVDAGDVINYSIVVKNTGNVTLTNVVVKDPMTGDTINVGTIAVGGKYQAFVTYTISQSDIDNHGVNLHDTKADDILTNVATASSDQTKDVSDDADTPIDYKPGLAITKDQTDITDTNGNNLVDAGDVINYSIHVTNTGDVTLTGVSVDDPMAGGILATGLTIAVGGHEDLTTSYTITQDDVDHLGTNAFDKVADDLITNKATADSNETGPESDTADTQIDYRPRISVEKSIVCPDDGDVMDADQSIKLLKNSDGTVTYQIVVKNTGNVALDIADILVTDNTIDLTNVDGEQGGGKGDHTDDKLSVGETLTYTVTADWAAGTHTNIGKAEASFANAAGEVIWEAGGGDGLTDSATYYGLDPHVTLNKLTNGVDGAKVLQGQKVTWTYDVKNDGNVDLDGVTVVDNPARTITAVLKTFEGVDYNSGDSDHDGVFDQGETWHFVASGAAVLGPYSNTATATGAEVTDDCGGSYSPEDTDGSSYTGLARALEGLTKGFWATHLTQWDVFSGSIGGGKEYNVIPTADWNKNGIPGTLSLVKTSGPSSTLGMVDGSFNGGGDSGLLLGDLNHNGLVDDNCTLFFDLASAQALANSSVTSDARIILASQAVAAQLNQYRAYVEHGYDSSPTGLLSEAAQWLRGQGLLSNGKSNVDTNTANDVGLPTKAVNSAPNPALGSDYTLNKGAITLKGLALSSSDDSWQKKAVVFSEASVNIDVNGDGDKTDSVRANGEGLKNALAAYNHGLGGSTAGFVTSTDGSLIGWEDNLGGTPYDVHANAKDVFWGILANHNITGVEWV